MYEAYYNLNEKPFSLLPDPDFLYLSSKHRVALAMLEYGLMSQAGFTVITGEIGSGKTTLVRRLLAGVDEDITVGMVSTAQSSFEELLRWVLTTFGLDHHAKEKIELHRTLLEFLDQQERRRRRTVLIIDEAQNLPPATLEELRLLSNINADHHQRMQLMLVGQPGLRRLLRRPEMEQVAQRVAVDYHLACLSPQETREYVAYRLARVGGDATLFDAEALAAIHESTRGTPRLINILCDTALVCGYAEQKPRIDAELVRTVAREKRTGGILPLLDGARADPAPQTRAQRPAAVRVSSGESLAVASPPAPAQAVAAAPAMTPDEFRMLFGDRGRKRR